MEKYSAETCLNRLFRTNKTHVVCIMPNSILEIYLKSPIVPLYSIILGCIASDADFYVFIFCNTLYSDLCDIIRSDLRNILINIYQLSQYYESLQCRFVDFKENLVI